MTTEPMTSQPADQPGNKAETNSSLDAVLRRSMRFVLASGAVMAVVCMAVFDFKAGSGVLVGAVVAVVNLFAFSIIVRALMNGKGAGWGVVGALKMIGLFVGAFLLFRSGYVDPLPFVAGYSALPLGSTLAQFFAPPDESDVDTPSAAPPAAPPVR